MHALGRHGLFQQPVDVDQGIKVSMQESTLGHLSNNLPEGGLLHLTLGHAEHHPGIESDIVLRLEAVLELAGPDGPTFLISDPTDNVARFSSDG